MIVLDTTVLVHAVGAEHPLRDPCRRLVRAVEHGVVEATTTVEVVQEFTHVHSRRRGRADAVGPAVAVARGVGGRPARRPGALPGVGQAGRRRPVLAATARTAGATALVSADQAFAGVAGLPHVIPDDDGVRQLLAS